MHIDNDSQNFSQVMQVNTSVNNWSTEVIDCCYAQIEIILLTSLYTLTLFNKIKLPNHNYACVYVT